VSEKSPAAFFWKAIRDGDVDRAFSVVADDATISILPAGIQDSAKTQGREFFESTVKAFPDLMLTVNQAFTGNDGVVVIELTMEGTQAADYLGVVNQEKHLDVDQAWLMKTANGTIQSISGYWCQNQLYRRLAVKRTDQVAIV